ncbi:hypothetical protein E3Q23_02767 [Wallemia mellicola]|uniref:NAD(P)-binding protein n=1 Tax=Wallemia mellicola TaxID=1708541 RepID=A0A4T0LVM0_9BASI|nr:hypothetical protein E3Q23_02767 [Wallemia mellicola]TIC64080.1 NAD(P)-binding protein [Wallemia mellicola]
MTVNIIITGANSGVGFGIALRLIDQLYREDKPEDAIVNSDIHQQVIDKGLTLILACRSPSKAQNAINQLKEYQNSKAICTVDLELVYEHCDLGTVESSVDFATRIKQKYSSLSSIICNAGAGTFTGLDWLKACQQIVTNPIQALTLPNYKLQSNGTTSADSIGWVFQTNIYGHFIIAKELESLLEKESQSSIIWMSSLEAAKCDYDIDNDFQFIKSNYSYEISKYLTEALAIGLEDHYREQNSTIHSVIVHPSVVWSSIFYDHLGWLLDLLMAISFYFARLLGSPNHLISAFLANNHHVKTHFQSPLLQLAEKDNGKSFVLVPCPSGTGQIINAFKNDEIDVSLALTESLLAGIAKGATEFKFVGTYIESPLNWAVITGANAPYTSIKDLEGTTIGISRKGSGSEVMANVMALQKEWKNPPKFLINDNFAKLRQSVNDGSTSCFMWEWFTTLPYVKTGEVKFIGNQLTPWPSWSIVAKPSLDRSLVAQFVDNLDQAVRAFDESRTSGEAVDYVAETFNYDKQDVQEWIKGVTYSKSHLRVVKKSVVESTLDTLVDAKVIEKNGEWDISQFVNRDIATVE